jgi:non-ribosomal peptide synthetase component F
VQERDWTSDYVLESQHTTRAALEIRGVTTLPELFKWQARRRGDATLFSFRGQPESALTSVSYTQAYETAVHLANVLHDLQRSSGSPTGRGGGGAPVVGILMEKSVELHLAILATTVSGATWLPFDADAPAARVSACLKDSKASILICDAAHQASASEAVKGLAGCRVVRFRELCRRQSADKRPRRLRGPKPHHTAYMIYTSGSTGTPKGIEIPHSAALTFSLSERSVLETGPEDIVWQGFSPAFDMFIEEV